MPAKAVFLDRDGVLNAAVVRNGRPYPPRSVAEVVIPTAAAATLARLRAAGYRLIVVTNQPDVARGSTTRAAVEAINDYLQANLPLDEIVVCWEDGDHPDRKPNPGMLLGAATRHGLDLATCWMIGDRFGDIHAGRQAGCRTILLGDGWGEASHGIAPDHLVGSLPAAIDCILASNHSTPGVTVSDRVPTPEQLNVHIWADGADKAGMLELSRNPVIKGFTTNPTLMAKAGIRDYPAFAKDILSAITDRPVSFEVFSDDIVDMERQARIIASWGKNVYTKIPITNTKGESCVPLVAKLAREGVRLNVTAILTLEQVAAVAEALRGGAPSVVSVFAGRIADTGRDPVPYMLAAGALLQRTPDAGLLWASTRELLNIYQAEASHCQVITVTHDVLAKLKNVNRGLDDYSLDTVKMFRGDALKAGFTL